jgi:Ni,Fe-hydrogenase maturation factor
MADATTAPPTMMSAAAAPSERIPPRRLFAFLIMVFGMFMSILDIQIVSASLSDIQAGLSASSTEVSWVQTAYLIAEVIAIPLSGFLSRAFGTRLLFAVSASGFTIASFFCGFASTIEQMVVMSRGDRLTLRDVPMTIRAGADLTKISVVRPGVTMTVEEAERQLIVQALREMNGNRTRAANRIGMSRRTMHRKLKKYGLEELPRIHLLIAKNAPTVVIVQRKRAKLFHIVLVDAAKRRIEEGSWFRGKLYALRCDVSFDGKHMVYLAMGSRGVFKSTDGAATWQPINNGLAAFIQAFRIDPSSPAVLYAGCFEAGVFRSTSYDSLNSSGSRPCLDRDIRRRRSE